MLAAAADDEAMRPNNSRIDLLCFLVCLHLVIPSMMANEVAAPKQKNNTEDCPCRPIFVDQFTNP